MIMGTADDIPSLLAQLCQSFVPTHSKYYVTQAQRRKQQQRHAKKLRRKAWDCLLFDYDEAYSHEKAVELLDGINTKIASNCYDLEDTIKLQKAIDHYHDAVGESSYETLSFLASLAGSVRKRQSAVIGYGKLPPEQYLTLDLLHENEIFGDTPLLAPPDHQMYTYYPPSLFSDSVMTVADSAFSELTSSAASSHFANSNFPVCDPDVYSQLPCTSEGLYLTKSDDSTRFKESDSTLYGALSNPYISDGLHSFLELPPIDVAPTTFDYTKPNDQAATFKIHSPAKSAAQSSIDGRHVRSDSGLGGDIIPPRDDRPPIRQPISWELQRRCGGYVGCQVEERPYLTEAGPAAFDLLFRLNMSCQLQLDWSRLSRSPEDMNNLESRRHLYTIKMSHLMDDISKLLVGVSSKCFFFDESTDRYDIKQALVVSGLSSQSLASSCGLLLDCGTYYYRLTKLCRQSIPGLTVTSFLRSVSHYISTYTASILQISPTARSPLHIIRLLNKQLQQIRFLAEICYCDAHVMSEYPPAELPEGIELLSYIYRQAQNFNCHSTYHLMLSLLYDTSQPYLRFLQDWVFAGRCSDPFEEFIIIVDPYKLEAQDRSYWTHGYLLDDQLKQQCLFMGDLSDQIYLGGKSLSLLRKINPDHELFTNRTDPPNINVCLTEAQQLHISHQSSVYVQRITAIIKHKLFTRQQMIEAKEQKKVEIIQKAQAEQAERLAVIYKKMSEKRQREEDKKKRYYNELMDNMEEVAARKSKEEIEEKERDAELVERLAKREQLQTEADIRLEQQAKEELIEYYRLLSETAAARERKALWRIRRHQLSETREQWLNDREREIQESLKEQQDIGNPGSRPTWNKPYYLIIKEQAENTNNVYPEVPDTETVPDVSAVHSSVEPSQSAEAVVDVPNVAMGGDDIGTDVIVTNTQTEATLESTLDVPHDSTDAAHSIPQDADISTHLTNKAGLHTPSLTDTVSSPGSATPTQRDVSQQSLNASVALDETLADVLSGAGHYSMLSSRRSTRPVSGKHASSTTFDKEYLIRRSVRRGDPNKSGGDKSPHINRRQATVPFISRQSVGPDTVSQQTQRGFQQMPGTYTKMAATTESDEPDGDAVRLERFRKINTRGHASHSSIQKIMYYGKLADDSMLEELDLPPIEPVRLEDVDEDLTHYQCEDKSLYTAAPTLAWAPSTDMRLENGLSLYEHISLPILLQQSVATALTAQISLSNQALMNHFMMELEFDKHMEILHNYLLMGNGEFSQAFTTPLFERLHSQDVISTYFLSDTLSKALQHVPLKDNPFADNVAISKTKIPRHLESYSLNAFSWLSLTYKVSWPMNILVPPEQLSKYERIFSFMVSLKHISYLLGDSWHSLKLSTQTHCIDSESHHFRQLHLIRHDMQHFVKVMHGYIALQVTEVTWHQFQTELNATVKDLDSLYDSHNKFINRCLLRCFLSHKLQQIKQVVDGILKSIYKFHALLRMGHWEQNEQGEFMHTEYDSIIKAYLPFKEFTQFLNKVLTKMTEFDKNQHLKELQVMLNFNGYY